ncbi:MAG: prepilin-type N-terminal cleavage/methylation domain-containing protein [Phycisphaerales bacterium]
MTRRRARSFTLVEALCVVAIVALAAAMLSGPLLGATESAAWRRAEAQVRRVDALARIAARSGGATRVAIADGGKSLAAVRDGDDAVPLATALLPDGFVVAFDPPQAEWKLVIDRAGRSADVAYVLSRRDRGMRLAVAGATGQIVRDGAGGEP